MFEEPWKCIAPSSGMTTAKRRMKMGGRRMIGLVTLQARHPVKLPGKLQGQGRRPADEVEGLIADE